MNGIDELLFIIIIIVLAFVTFVSACMGVDAKTDEARKGCWKVFKWTWKIAIPLVVWFCVGIRIPYEKTEVMDRGEFPLVTYKGDDGSSFQTCSFPSKMVLVSSSGCYRDFSSAMISDTGVIKIINVTKITNKIFSPNTKLRLTKYFNQALGVSFSPVTDAEFVEPGMDKYILRLDRPESKDAP